MKKLLLTTVVAAIALAASAFTLNVTNREMVAHEFHGQITNQANQHKKAQAKKIGSISELPGNYLCYYESYFNDNAPTYCDVTIKAGTNANEIIITGLWGSYAKDLTATVDVSTATITIPRQSFYEYTGDTPADFVNVNEPDAPVSALITSDCIMFVDPWGAILTEGSSAGHFYVIGQNTLFLKPTANMTWNYNGTKQCNVQIRQNNDTVHVGNFGGWGVDIYAVLNADHTFTIPKQFIEDAGSNYGVFYTAGTDGSSVWDNITGTGTATTLTSDHNWTGYAPSTGYWYNNRGAFTITMLEGEIVWPITVTGLVTDQDNQPLEGVDVTIEVMPTTPAGMKRLSEEGPFTGTTDTEGKYYIDIIPIDAIYTVIFEKEGYKPYYYETQNLTNMPTVVLESKIVGVNDINVSKNVASVKYGNAAGQVSNSTFNGLNIVVTRYTDGTIKVSTVVK